MNSETPQFPDPPRLMARQVFVTRFGGIYEHSAWVAEALWDWGLGRDHDSVAGLQSAMAAIVDAASDDKRLALIRAHPELAGRLAAEGSLTAESTGEQSSAGLDHCTAEELERFRHLNRAYGERFGFPFVMAVKGRTRAEILSAFEARLENLPTAEFAAAIAEIHKIARLRLEALARSGS